MKLLLFILFIILAVVFSELLSLYLEDITAYMGGFTLSLFTITKLIDFMERKLAMEWWNNLLIDERVAILAKYHISRLPKTLTGREIEIFYKQEHKPINV